MGKKLIDAVGLCTNWELLQLRQRYVGNIEKRNVIETTSCVQTSKGVIWIKNSTSLT